MKVKSKFLVAMISAALAVNMIGGISFQNNENNKISAANSTIVEKLNRGISAVKTESGMLISWRYLANDPVNTVYKLYRDGALIYTSNANEATCYLDAGGGSNSKYRVDTVVNGEVVSSDNCTLISGNTYFDVPVSPPGSGYTPNDMTVGDVDGDGEYELFLKWEPDNSKDNSHSGVTGKVYIDCLKLNGIRLWRIDLGVNIRAGAHYTQMLVADFDLDGSAEMIVKTADGTVDGKGNVIGNAYADYRNSSGYILSGPEYLTLFDGRTGSNLHTINYKPERGTVSSWGDNYGNRVDRFLGAVAYLDGVKPSAVTIRGYYTRMTATAYDVVNKKLIEKWAFDTGNSSSAVGYGDGNHNCMPADVDGDGKQEIVLGATTLDHDGKVLWNTNAGHGDALHVGDLLPDRAGIEVYMCHENSPYGVSLIEGSSGKTIWRKPASGDTGRCCAGNVWSGNAGSEFWGVGNDVYNGSGSTISMNRPPINFLIYWDGDLERETLNGYTDSPAVIQKVQANGKLTTLLETTGYYTCNTTKGTPCLSADIFGDWREEVIVRAADSKSVRIYCSPYDTDYRIVTLMHDPQYRNQVAGQNIAYNQPPHPSFYLGSERPIPTRPDVTVNGSIYVPPISIEPLNGTLIKSLNRFDTDNYENWSIQENVKNGDKIYGDRDYTFITLPTELTGAEWIKTACNSKALQSTAAEFTADKSITVYIALDTRVVAANLEWLSSWTKNEMKFESSNDVKYDVYEKKFNAGETITLGTNGPSGNVVMYSVFVKKFEIPKLNGMLIKSLACYDENNHSKWSIQSNLQTNNIIFGDRDFTITSLPDVLRGAEWIRTSCDSKFWDDVQAEFIAGDDIIVSILLDTRSSATGWISNWKDTGLIITSSNDVTFKVLQADFQKGETVILGSNGPSSGVVNYFVAVLPQGTSQTALGDINEDGKVDEKDVILLKKYLLGSVKQIPNYQLADIDASGDLTTFDLIILKKKILF